MNLAQTLLPLLLLPLAMIHAEDEIKPLVIVAPKGFEGELKEFVAWKKSLQPTEFVALEEALQQGEGADAPEKLKRYLYSKWRKEKIGYVLLVGDVDVLPVRYMVLDRKTEPAFDFAFYPSDLYYADLAKQDGSFEDWNAQKEGFHGGYIGEVRGEANKGDPINYDEVDYLPEVAVGRWPVSTGEEAKRIASKSTAYERKVIAETDAKLRRAAFFAVDGWVDTRDLLEALAGKLSAGWQTEKRFYGTDKLPSPAEVRGILNEGAGLMVHTGHGNPDRWEQCFSLTDLDLLTNSSSVPVFISAGCSTAHFAPLPPYEPYVDRDGNRHKGTDHGEKFTEPPIPPSPIQTGNVNPTCLGEQLLKREGIGGVAYIGCNTGSQPFGLKLVGGFILELSVSPTPRLGDCWSSAIRYYVEQQKLRELKPTESWVPPSIFFQGMKFMVFGDPSLRLPTNKLPAAAETDLRPMFQKHGLTPRNQGGRGTCSVFAVTAAMEFALAAKEKAPVRLSVEYLNWASNQAVGKSVDGGFFSDLWKGYRAWGICREAELPYAAAFNADLQPEASLIESAKKRASDSLQMHWIKRWNVKTGLTQAELDGIKAALGKGWPVCGGFRWPKREQWKQGVLQMCPPEAVFDGHSVLIVASKADSSQPGGGTFTFYNSNRPDMECRMTWEYATAYMNDALWIESAGKD